MVSEIYALTVYFLLAVGLGKGLLMCFQLSGSALVDANIYLLIQSTFIPLSALSIGGLLIFQATNKMGLATFIAVLQGFITFPIAATIMYFGASSAQNAMLFVITTPLNSGMAAMAVSTISCTYIYHYLGRVVIKPRFKQDKIRLNVPLNDHAMSYAERQLDKFIPINSKNQNLALQQKLHEIGQKYLNQTPIDD